MPAPDPREERHLSDPRPQRKLAAILAADVVGYSSLMEADEAGTLKRVKTAAAEIVEPAVAARGGRIVKTTGDGLMAEFSSAVDAVDCAIAIQRAMAEREAGHAALERLRYRIGVNLGDVIEENGDIFGDGVNLATRLEALAEPGDVAVSGTVHDQVEGKVGVVFTDVGRHTVKNMARPVQVWRWGPEPAAPPLAAPVPSNGAPRLLLPDKPSIAVLPFENRSPDPEQDFFADGITEDIITELSRSRNLFVIARNTSYSYKGRAVDAAQVARELGVRYVLEGSVRRAGNRLRLNAHLINAPTRKHVWSDRYDRDVEDVFAVQDEITQTIVTALEPEVIGAERGRANRAAPESLDAWGLYQRGLGHIYRFTHEDIAKGEALFARAIAADPNFARAHAGLSFAYFSYAFLGYRGERARYAELAMETATRSVDRDARDPVGHWALARAFMIRGQLDEAIASFTTAIDLNPNFAHAYYNLAWAQCMAGQAAEAMANVDRAQRLSPRDPLLFAFIAMRAQAAFQLREFKAAADLIRQAMREPGAHIMIRAMLVAILGKASELEEAKAELARLHEERPGFSQADFFLAFPYRKPEGRALIREGLAAAGMPA
jgi:adenylate cyclase